MLNAMNVSCQVFYDNTYVKVLLMLLYNTHTMAYGIIYYYYTLRHNKCHGDIFALLLEPDLTNYLQSAE